jgi:hypothetical protein
MNKSFHGLYELVNDIAAFMLCLAIFFGIASEAFASPILYCPTSPSCGSKGSCGRLCEWRARCGTCVIRGIPTSPGDDEDPTDTLNSPNSDPLPPSSGAVAPPIGNPAP